VKVRNPLSGFLLTILGALGLSVLVPIPVVLFVPWIEIQVFIIGFIMFAIGVVAGRSSLLGSMGFVGAFVGGFFGSLAFSFLLWPTGWEYLLALLYSAICGLGGAVTGKLGLRRIDRMVQSMPKSKRCSRCGARVGLSARKCWSCRAYLPPT